MLTYFFRFRKNIPVIPCSRHKEMIFISTAFLFSLLRYSCILSINCIISQCVLKCKTMNYKTNHITEMKILSKPQCITYLKYFVRRFTQKNKTINTIFAQIMLFYISTIQINFIKFSAVQISNMVR